MAKDKQVVSKSRGCEGNSVRQMGESDAGRTAISHLEVSETRVEDVEDDDEEKRREGTPLTHASKDREETRGPMGRENGAGRGGKE